MSRSYTPALNVEDDALVREAVRRWGIGMLAQRIGYQEKMLRQQVLGSRPLSRRVVGRIREMMIVEDRCSCQT